MLNIFLLEYVVEKCRIFRENHENPFFWVNCLIWERDRLTLKINVTLFYHKLGSEYISIWLLSQKSSIFRETVAIFEADVTYEDKN